MRAIPETNIAHYILLKLNHLVLIIKIREMIVFLCLRTSKMLSFWVFVRCESHQRLSMFYMFIMDFYARFTCISCKFMINSLNSHFVGVMVKMKQFRP